MIIPTEIGEGRDRLHRDAIDFSLGVDTECDVGGLDRLIGKAGDESIVLPMIERAAHARSRLEVDGQFIICVTDFDVAIPRIDIDPSVAGK